MLGLNLEIDFIKLLKTCCHEIAHYIQLVKHERSSCKSDLVLNKGNYNEELAREHKEFSKEIFGAIKNSEEYLEWEKNQKKLN